MTRTEADLVTSLENKVRAQQVTIHQLYREKEYLLAAVELLSLPQPTTEDLEEICQGLIALGLRTGEMS